MWFAAYMAIVAVAGFALAYIVLAAVEQREIEDWQERRESLRRSVQADIDPRYLPETITQYTERIRKDETEKAAADRPRLSTNRNLGIARPGTRNISAAEDK